MRIFAIKDDTLPKDKILGYLIYYEIARSFFIEVEEHTDPWELPLILFDFARRKEYSLDSYWSQRWIQQRIVPRDRQNLGEILRENGLKRYDEFDFLMLASGRCGQDDCYLEEIPADPLPTLLLRRWQTKVHDIVPLAVPRLLVFFRNGTAKIVDVSAIKLPECLPYLSHQERFNTVEVQPDGYGIWWNKRARVAHSVLFQCGTDIPISLADFQRYIQKRVVNTAEACRIMDCSRQNIDDLMRRGKLHSLRTDTRYKLFSRAEVVERKKGSE